MLARIKATTYLRDVTSWSVGENLAWGSGTLATPRAMVRAWMQSADHRANLLDRHFADVGDRRRPGRAGRARARRARRHVRDRLRAPAQALITDGRGRC